MPDYQTAAWQHRDVNPDQNLKLYLRLLCAFLGHVLCLQGAEHPFHAVLALMCALSQIIRTMHESLVCRLKSTQKLLPLWPIDFQRE